jgi:hypothetical protein
MKLRLIISCNFLDKNIFNQYFKKRVYNFVKILKNKNI